MEGPLCKWSSRGGGWQQRWFVLEEGLLVHYATEAGSCRGRGSIHLCGATMAAGQDPASFTLQNHSKQYLLKAESEEEKERWMAALQLHISAMPAETGDSHSHSLDSDLESCDSEGDYHDASDSITGTFSKLTNSHTPSPLTPPLTLPPASITPSLSLSPSSPPILPSSQLAGREVGPCDVEEDPEYREDNSSYHTVAQNKSIIGHILSQATRGLDLTRLSLPAFILESRSTLDMCSEFLAHPDLFTAIPDHTSPRERMVAVTRFLCSSFHSTRTSECAKKPYNPILGETFHCFWDLPQDQQPHTEQTMRLLQSGPVPYASYNSVTFVAEQVSHHPPVSGFYAEYLPKRMYITGSVQTKIRFLGLSVGVYNTATVHFHLLDHKEEYIMTLPNTYIRSLLTQPWMELGGVSSISCPQTGYSTRLNFHCKPLYGGKKHHLTCSISHTSEKKPFLEVEGEWNGVMCLKDSQEVFVDTINTPTVRKKLLKLSAQDPGESRRRWQHVTEALKRGDMEAASQAKYILEERQRAEAKRRQEEGREWKQKLFHQKDGHWVYNWTLPSRLQQLEGHTEH